MNLVTYLLAYAPYAGRCSFQVRPPSELNRGGSHKQQTAETIHQMDNTFDIPIYSHHRLAGLLSLYTSVFPPTVEI